MKQSHRLNNIGLINRDKVITFNFNGKSYQGYEGDTLASALLANGVHLVGRSFKYHRPCLLYTSPSPRDNTLSRMPSSA